MKKILITGGSGFVAKHFIDLMTTTHPEVAVVGVDIVKPATVTWRSKTLKLNFKKINLLNRKRLDTIIRDFKPDSVLHLAALSSVVFSQENPVESFCNNTNIFLNLVESLRHYSPRARLLSVGSSQEYGKSDNPRPLKESDVLHPTNPYGIARVSQEMLAVMYAKNFHMNIILTRSFNHVGIGQKPEFVIASFVNQFAMAKKRGCRSLGLHTGNINLVRDFTDVKDVVIAYAMLLKSGQPGEIYNICSGRGVSLRDVISLLETITGIKARILVDKTLRRSDDPQKIVGDYSKIHAATGWKPRISLKNTLTEMIEERILNQR